MAFKGWAFTGYDGGGKGSIRCHYSDGGWARIGISSPVSCMGAEIVGL